jgi:hypothetical protein
VRWARYLASRGEIRKACSVSLLKPEIKGKFVDLYLDWRVVLKLIKQNGWIDEN